MAKIVIGLGGNALGDTPVEQKQLIDKAVTHLIKLIEAGHQVVLSHGNGPQVGMLKTLFTEGSQSKKTIPSMPLAECTAMTQGYIGFHMQHILQNRLLEKGMQTPVVALVTQTVVDAEDPAFKTPTKPIGAFFTEEQAKQLSSDEMQFIEDSGRGYREVVASPQPIDIVESSVIKQLIESGCIVISGGGGGIPVVRSKAGYQAVNAVIDKDKTSSLMARKTESEIFIILTAVDAVAVNFGKPNQIQLSDVNTAELANYIAEGHFAPGSMLPKVEAAIDFVKHDANALAIITSIDKVLDAVNGQAGTRIRL